MKTLTADTDIDAASDTYVRASDFAKHIGGVHFPTEVWAVFAQCEAARTPAEIARRTRLNTADVISALRRLSSKHLIRKNEIDWLTYLATLSTPPAIAHEEESVIAIIAPLCEPVVAAAPMPPAPPPAAPPSAAQPLEFILENPSAAIARRQAAREVLTFQLGKPSAKRSAGFSRPELTFG